MTRFQRKKTEDTKEEATFLRCHREQEEASQLKVVRQLMRVGGISQTSTICAVVHSREEYKKCIAE